MATASHQLSPELAYVGFVVSFAEGTFANCGLNFGGRVDTRDSPMSYLSKFGTDSNTGVWDVGAIVKWRWHVSVGLLPMV